MRRLPTMLASASAAALTTLAITVAVPAIADDAGGAKGADEFLTCLSAHGLRGAPGAIKPWLGARLERGDAVAERAMKACAEPKRMIVKTDGPSEQDLRSCLARHGAAIPAGDGRVLKNWILEHGDDAANRSAMRACHFMPPDKATVAGPCTPKPAGRPGPGKPATAD